MWSAEEAEKFWKEIVAERNETIKQLQEKIDRYEDLALKHQYQTILDEME